MAATKIRIGAVRYCPEVSDVWSSIAKVFKSNNINLVPTLFNTYEDQNQALITKNIDIAWNSPLAHCRLKRQFGHDLVGLGMRDVDCDFQTLLVVKANRHDINSLKDLNNTTIAAGPLDSPQAYILPFYFLNLFKTDLKTVTCYRHDGKDVGLHGDTFLGQKQAFEMVAANTADAGIVSEFAWESLPNRHEYKVFKFPTFDHCMFDAIKPNVKKEDLTKFQTVLMSMTMSNPEHQTAMKLEGIKREWRPPREEGYKFLMQAIEKEVPGPYPRPYEWPFKKVIVV